MSELAQDLETLASASAPRFDRRRALALLGGGTAVAALLAACRVPVTGGGYGLTPQEIAGPFPADGSNGPNVLTSSGIVRCDIRSSFGGLTGSAIGVPLTIRLRITDVSNGNLVKPGVAVYLWHCDQLGRYSLYSPGVTNQNYLRGVQVTDQRGWVTFTSVFPGCYPGRWPHIHFEVYPSLEQATSYTSKLATLQLALPQSVSAAVYARSAYAGSAASLAAVSLATDISFADGYAHEMAAVTGNATNGYVATLVVAVP